MGAVDGPGLRYVVFMQGCPLRCIYCHNPDTWAFGDEEKEVIKGVTQNLKSKAYTPQEVVNKIDRYKTYIKEGGVTVTGGEPLSQAEFVTELFTSLHKEGIHTCLDTSGIGNISSAKKVLEVTDLALVDVKFLNHTDYKKYTGGDFDKVIAFLNLTKEMNVPIWIRQVIVPTYNDTKEDVLKLKEFLAGYPNVEKVELLPFRKLCMEKYDNLGIEFPLRETAEAGVGEVARLQKIFSGNSSK
jgi:pyruvate formate lyase activating enzyme